MDIKEISSIVSLIKSNDRNIEGWEKLKGRELCIIPTDSDYYKEFQVWVKENYSCRYDGEKNVQPSYVSGSTATEFLDIQIDRLNKFIEPHKAKLNPILD